MSRKGCLVIISGFSGAGKGTVVKALMERFDCYALSISATTRQPRPGEENGREYFFKTKEEFEELIRQDALYEYAQYVSNYYGTPKAYVEEQLEAGKDVILEIEVQGALKVKEKNPDALLLFVTPPSAQELKRRLEGRGTETPEVIEERMARAAQESLLMNKYDYLVVNDQLDECVETVHQLIQREHLRMTSNQDMVAKIKKELSEMKGEKAMIHPSYTELIQAVNSGNEQDDTPVCNSRYSIVLATSKRARQIIAGADPLVHYPMNKPLSIAVEEVYQGKVKIIPDTTSTEEEQKQEPAAPEI